MQQSQQVMKILPGCRLTLAQLRVNLRVDDRAWHPGPEQSESSQRNGPRQDYDPEQSPEQE